MLQTPVLPTSYDLRAAYPACYSIGYIRDQANCGSCWAVSTMTSLSDRHCVNATKAGAPAQRAYSYEDVLECCNDGSCAFTGNAGCNGGYPTGAFKWAKNKGIVTGEQYGNKTFCKPYYFKPDQTTPPPAPLCNKSCTKISGLRYSTNLLKTYGYTSLRATSTLTTEQVAQAAIIDGGSIVATYEVFEDFFYYAGGVYKKTSNVSAGWHAVRVIGWGEDVDAGKYWLVANSWGTWWGEAGFFRIARGTNECSFETNLIAGKLKL